MFSPTHILTSSFRCHKQKKIGAPLFFNIAVVALGRRSLACRERQRSVQCSGFLSSMCRFAWLRAAKFLGHVFVCLLVKMNGKTRAERQDDLRRRVHDGYRAHPLESKLDQLTASMLCLTSNAPMLKVHACEVRGLLATWPTCTRTTKTLRYMVEIAACFLRDNVWSGNTQQDTCQSVHVTGKARKHVVGPTQTPRVPRCEVDGPTRETLLPRSRRTQDCSNSWHATTCQSCTCEHAEGFSVVPKMHW